MKLYIDNGQFGEFVFELVSAENKRRKEEAQKAEEQKMWELYLHSFSDKSFIDWKAEVTKSAPQTNTKDADMTTEDVDRIIKHLFKPAQSDNTVS